MLLLRSAEQRAVLTAMEALSTVERAPQLVDCVRSALRTLLPHGVFVFGAGRVKGNGFTDYEPLGYRFPLPYLDEMRAADGTIQTPSIVRWLRTGAPQLFESKSVARADAKPWLQAFNRHDLDNMAAHGVVDRRSGNATYFSFFQIPARLEERHARILRFLVPHLHLSLQRCAVVTTSPRPAPLSEVQREILRYLCLGKTNWEIARILGLSDRNAKYHVEEIIRKLGVANRTEAAAKAATLGVIDAT